MNALFTRKELKALAFYNPEELANLLEIKPSTLRKYSLMLEKKGYEFKKNAQGHRWYDDTDIVSMRKLITFKNSNAMSLEDSIDAVLLWKKGGDIAPADTTHIALYNDTDNNKNTLEEMRSKLDQQQETIEKLLNVVHELSKQNTTIIQSLNDVHTKLEEEKQHRLELQNITQEEESSHDSTTEPTSFFQRLFNKKSKK